MTKHLPLSFTISLYLCVFITVFSMTAPIMAGPYISSDLGGSNEISSYGVTFYALGNGLVFPLSSSLGTRHGKVKTLMLCLIFFCICTFLCALAPTFLLFNLIRFFQGACAGTFFPLGFSLLSENLNEEQKQTALSNIALLTTVTPVLGATFGGWIAYDFNWRWIFYAHIPLVFTVLFFIRVHTKSIIESKEKTPVDWIGFLSFAISVSSFVTIITLGQELDWFRSDFICFLSILCVLFLLFFILWEKNQSRPFFDLSLFIIPSFAFSVLYVSMLFSAYFGMIILLAQWLHLFVNYTPIWVGILLSHMAVAGVIIFYLVLKWLKKTSPWIPVFLALVFFAISCFYSATFNAETNFGRVAISRILAGFALAFFLFPLLLIVLRSIPKEKTLSGLGMFQSFRLISGALGCSIYTTLWYRRRVFYHDRLGSDLTALSEKTEGFFQSLDSFHIQNDSSKLLLDQALDRQATALALADCFYFMAWTMVILLILLSLFCFKTKKPLNA